MTKQMARTVAGRVEIDPTPARLRWGIDDLVAGDGHKLNVTFDCGVRALDDATERKLFFEVFLRNASAVSGDDVVTHFLPAMTAAAAGVAGKTTAEVAIAPESAAAWSTAMKQAAEATAFSCGLEILAPFDVQVVSPSLQRQRAEQMQRTAADRRYADRAGQFTRAAELLKQWESLRASVPTITPGQLLQQLNPADRGAMLDTLLMTGDAPGTGADLWAVAGPSLFRIDAALENPVPKLIPMPTTVGPLRSLRFCGNTLWVGGRCGLLRVDPSDPTKVLAYHYPGLTSEHGFTAATAVAGNVWACHKEAGLVRWKHDQPAAPIAVFKPATLGGDAKHLVRRGPSVMLAVGNNVLRVADDALHPVMTASADVVSILEDDSAILVVAENGIVTSLDATTLEPKQEYRHPNRVTGAGLLPWLSASRLLLIRRDGPIDCVGLEDQLVTQYAGGHVGVRAVAAAAGYVAAMSSDRQRLILYHSHDGRKPAADLYITGVARHRLTDLTFNVA